MPNGNIIVMILGCGSSVPEEAKLQFMSMSHFDGIDRRLIAVFE